MPHPALRALVHAVLVLSVYGMYRDQAGTVDWHHKYVGVARDAAVCPDGRAFAVATEENTVALLRADTGKMSWRTRLPDDQGTTAVVCGSAYVASFSPATGIVRAFARQDGALDREVALPRSFASGAAPTAARGTAVAFLPPGGSAVVITNDMFHGDVHMVDVGDAFRAESVAFLADGSLAVAGRSAAGAVALARVTPSDGAVSAWSRVSTDRMGDAAKAVRIDHDGTAFIVAFSGGTAPSATAAVNAESGALVVSSDGAAAASARYSCACATAASDSAVVCVDSDRKSARVAVLTDAHSDVAWQALGDVGDRGRPAWIRCNAPAPAHNSGANNIKVHCIAAFTDGTLIGVHRTGTRVAVEWVRDEALARAVSVRVVASTAVVSTARGGVYGLAVRERGRVLWRRAAACAPARVAPIEHATAAASPRVALASVCSDADRVVCEVVAAETGERVGERTEVALRDATLHYVPGGAVVARGAAVDGSGTRTHTLCGASARAVDGATGVLTGARGVSGFALDSGALVWHAPLPALAASTAALPVGKDTALYHTLADGTVLVRAAVGSTVAVASAAPRGVVVSVVDGGSGAVLFRRLVRGWDERRAVALAAAPGAVAACGWASAAQRAECALFEAWRGAWGEESAWTVDDDASGSAMREAARVSEKILVAPSAVRAITFTDTMHGITPRMLVLALESGHIASIDARKLEQGATVQEPTPYMRLNPKMYLSYYKQIQGVRSIHAFPTDLESTSQIMVLGTDLFYAQVSPVKTFDKLNEDFNHVLLVGLMIVLVAITIITQLLVKRKTLHEKWA